MPPFLTHIVLPLACALGAGLAIGLERQRAGQSAGGRTHALMGLSCALIVLLAAPGAATTVGEIDPGRVIQGVLAGLGLLCAGVVVREGLTIHGLTTAASMYAAAALGLAFGAGAYPVGIAGLIGGLALLVLIKPLESRMSVRIKADLRVRYAAETAPRRAGFVAWINQEGVACEKLSQKLSDDRAWLEFYGSVTARDDAACAGLAERLRGAADVAGFDLSLRGA